MLIELLADRPEFMAPLAKWHQAEWGLLRPGYSLEDRVEKLRSACGRSQPPLTFVATDGEDLLGSAMLLPHDMDTRPDLTPWLAGVFTLPDFRGRGVASALSRHVVQCSREAGFDRIHLYTPSAERFYARLGWFVSERTRYLGIEVTVMHKDLRSGEAEAGS